ncbi:MAG: SMP-30/gluconolactonase/LRE family protein [Deltaproteobacteria bacterium]|nr:SMP-30/gluconolactonase/LRE family protein [Deltaproteobacteria bacterium]
MRKTLKTLLTLLIPVLIYGCAAPPLPDLVWPEPPEPPRVKYIRDYRSTADFASTSVATAILLGGEGGSPLRKPMGVFTDNSGKIYVTDTAAADVFILDTVNKKGTTLAGLGTKLFYKPIGVTTDAGGRIFVADSQTDKVAVLDPQGQLISYLNPDAPFKGPTGIAADSVHKKLYVTDTQTHDIRVFDLESLKQIKTMGKRGREEGEFNYPSHIAVDNKGNLYVVDTMNGRIQIFDSEGKFVKAFGKFGDAPGLFARPKGIGVDSEGHIYVVDAAFNNVQVFDDDGNILLAFSSYGSDRGKMILPAGMAIDKDDYIYVVDSWNRRVEVFEYLGEKHKARQSASKDTKK